MQAWVTRQQRCDVLLAPFEAELQFAAAPRSGERVLDVGCGAGTTTAIVAAAVGPAGHVTGVDVAPRMLEAARDLVAATGLSNVTIQQGDAEHMAFEGGPFDLAVSRFGVMYFRDPVRAFGNVARSLRATGRVVFTCFQSLDANPWVAEPVAVLRRHLPRWGGGPLPGHEAFSLDDPDRVRSILRVAGFDEVRIEGVEAALVVGGHDGVDGAVDLITGLDGPRALLAAADAVQCADALAALRDLLDRHVTGHTVRLRGAAWVVTAGLPGAGG